MSTVLADARHASGLTLVQLADLAQTSHPALSAYERGRKQPRVSTLERILGVMGFELSFVPTREYEWHHPLRGRPFAVPTALPRLQPSQAFATVSLPVTVDWSGRPTSYDLRVREDRVRVYQLVIREGTPEDIETYIDGALLIDMWDEIPLPAQIRREWEPVIDAAVSSQGQRWHGDVSHGR